MAELAKRAQKVSQHQITLNIEQAFPLLQLNQLTEQGVNSTLKRGTQ